MKKSILGSFIGLSIVLSLDSLTRVFAALFFDQEILMFSYTGYPGIVTPVLLVVMAALSSFLGGLFAFTYGKTQQAISLVIFLILIILLRYGQIHLLYPTEGIVYPIVGLIVSILSVFLSWKVIRPAKITKEPEEFNQQHHHPLDSDM